VSAGTNDAEGAGLEGGESAAGSGPHDLRWILTVLPHRYPLLLVDRVLEMEPRQRVVAIKNVTFNEPHFQGHFPGQPVFPGVLMIEALAQAGGLLLLHDLRDREKKLLYFTSIDDCRFRRPVVPGDQMRLELEVLRLRSSYCRLRGRVTVDGELAAEATIASAIVDR
jgi:beta-hydroxyacyl-ACP dehydratase FabZ